MNSVFLLLVGIIQFIGLTAARGLSFSSPNLYKQYDKVDLLINKIQSDYSQLPYSYFELPFTCPQVNAVNPITLSLGQVLRGDRIAESDYKLSFNNDTACETSCMRLVTKLGIRKAREMIKQKYSNEWLIDGLPGATTLISTDDNSKYYLSGFPLGFINNGKYYINNHAMIVIRFHKETTTGESSIVGFEVYPKSVSNNRCPGASNNYKNFEISEDLISDDFGGQIIPYSYSVYWREETLITWNNRWDLYISKEENLKPHYASLIGSLLLAIVYTVITYNIVKKVVNGVHNDPHASGPRISANWRRLKNDIFSAPSKSLLLAVLAGAGAQLAITFSCVITLFALNILHNNVPGRVLSYAVFIFIFSASISGYVTYFFYDKFSRRDQKQSKIQRLESTSQPKVQRSNSLNATKRKLKLANKTKQRSDSQANSITESITGATDAVPKLEKDWFHVSFFAGAAIPGFIIITMLFLNFFIWAKESSTALPFGTIILLVVFYFFCEIPLALIGGYVAYQKSLKNFEKRLSLPAPVTSPIASPQLDSFTEELNNNGSIDAVSENEKTFAPRRTSRSQSFHNSRELQKFYIKHINSTLIFGLVPFLSFYTEILYIFKVIWLQKNTFYHLYGFLLLSIILVTVLVAESVIITVYLQLNNSNNYRWQWKAFSVGGSISSYVFLYSTYYYFRHFKEHYDFVSILLYFTYSFLIYLLFLLSFGSIGLLSAYFFIRSIYGVKKID